MIHIDVRCFHTKKSYFNPDQKWIIRWPYVTHTYWHLSPGNPGHQSTGLPSGPSPRIKNHKPQSLRKRPYTLPSVREYFVRMRMRILMLSKCEQDYNGDMPSFMKLGTCQLLNKSYISSADLNQHVSNLSHSPKKVWNSEVSFFFWNKETYQSFKLPHPFPHANGLSFWRMRTHRTVHRHLRLRPTPADRFAAMEGCKPMQSIQWTESHKPVRFGFQHHVIHRIILYCV